MDTKKTENHNSTTNMSTNSDLQVSTNNQADPEMIFKFFYNNHHIFKMISQEDYTKLDNSQNQIRQMTLLATGGALFTIAVVNKTLLRNKNIQNKSLGTKNLQFMAKYIAFPIATGLLSFGYYRRQFNQTTNSISKQYNFAFEDYNNAMKYLETAKKEGKLDELLEKGRKIDRKSIGGVHPSSM